MKKIALVFPGQGSQKIGMLAELAQDYQVITETFTAASHALGYDLWQLIQSGPVEQLDQTEYAQPALLAADFAVWCVWKLAGGVAPTYLAGHSLGEYAALVCAGSIKFADALLLVAERGRIMQSAVASGKGAMLAIVGLDDFAVQQICLEAAQGEVLAPANYNSIGQVVVAGETAAIERALESAKKMGAKIAKILPVSVPSHCELMRVASEKLRERLEQIEIKAPSIPVIHNADVSAHKDPGEIRDLLVRQLYSPVRWVETVQFLAKQIAVESVFECGPGKVLTGLNKRIEADLFCESLALPQGFGVALNWCK